MKIKRKIIEIDESRCDGCGNCVVACAESALKIIDGKAKVISDHLCDGLGACMGDCPQGALSIVEREADEFDAEAVEKHLEALESTGASNEKLACGCPSSQIQSFVPASACQCGTGECSSETTGTGSMLRHWPVQIRLVPANAPFLKGARLLVAADCVPVAYPSLHRDFLADHVIMIGCPKFDETNAYIDKFAEIFKTADISDVTVMAMEVPCCSSLPVIVQKGMEKANVVLPLRKITVSARGEILEEEK
ncbi:4Fe-4S binding protein [Desulfosarcina sp. OttesenSCG-928-A07]|nr:4Fe-4S binding protein [Desulfosarcina sp. OttesenSCG-928-G17]MDL2330072.1 4Fe-4S binding protein [Desulfosarcina sp. OttesenSCG-928-A07]